ncbi:MAG: apolipoprotein N-acyltransferase [Bdellovibrionia bacterium]
MRKLRQIPLPHWGTALSSILIVAAYPPWDLRYLIWICLIPWLYALSQTRTWRQSVTQGLWLSILMSFMGFHWVAYVLKQFGDLPWIVAITGLGLYSLIGQPQFLLFGAVFSVVRTRSSKFTAPAALLATMALALIYTGIDWAIPKLFRDTLGHAFYSAPWLRQSAELGGAHLLTFAAMWINLALFALIETRRSREMRKTALIGIALPLALIAGLSVFGYQRANLWRDRLAHPESGQENLQAAIVQANIGDFEKVAAERGMQQAAEKILADYFSLSDQAVALAKKPDIVIWPETAYASTFGKPMTTGDYSRDQRIETWVKSTRTPLVFGSYDRDEGKDYNTLFALSPVSSPQLATLGSVSESLQFYHKNILLMFGEYIPFQDALPAIGRLFPQVANFGRGPGPELMQIPTLSGSKLIPASPAICYEVLFPNYVIEAARKGSRFILNVTNDSWFGPYGEPHLHLALSTFRTIETRLPMVRATNTGFSALVTQDGEIASKSHLFEPEILNVSVPLLDSPWTLMKAWGDWFGQFALVLGAILILALNKRYSQTGL